MTSAPDPRPERPRRRWGRRLFLGILLVTILGATIGWRYRVGIAEQTAQAVMQAFNLGDGLSFRVAEVEFGRIRLEDLRLGSGGPDAPDRPRAAAVEIAFRPAELVSGRIREVRLIRPVFAVDQTEAGGVSINGMDLSATDADPAPTDTFPNLPDVQRVEIVDAQIMLDVAGFEGVALGDGVIVRQETGGFLATLTVYGAAGDGRQATVTTEGAVLNYGPDQIAVAGPVKLSVADPAVGAAARADIFLNLRADADGALDLDAILMSASGRLGPEFGFGGGRGRLQARLPAGQPPAGRASLSLTQVRAPSTAFDIAAIDVRADDAGIHLAIDGVGPTGYLDLDLEAPDVAGPLGIGARGEIDARALAVFLTNVEASGRVRVEAGGSIDLQSMMRKPEIRHISGAAKITFEVPKVSISPVAPDGAVRGIADLELSGGVLNVTARGISLSGVNLPDELLAGLPADVRGAFAEPAFVRLGGPGIADTIIALSNRPDGGVSAVGRLGLAVSNPNLAVFLEGDAALATDKFGAVEHLESERLVVRMVDAVFGDAHFGGRMELFGLSGAGERFTAEATLEATASIKDVGIAVENVEFDLKGPFVLDAGQAQMRPEPGGQILIEGYAGPQLSAAGPVRLTLTPGRHSVTYDRQTDRLDAALDFAGFRTRGVLNADQIETGDVDLKLGGLGVALTEKGVAISLKAVAARFPAYDLVLGGGDARIAFGGAAAQSGRLVIARIYHDVEEPVFAPLTLRVDVEGRGERLSFKGALLAADDQARLDVDGFHDLPSGRGAARIVMPPIVFAPGVLQPQDFVPGLYRNIFETVGEIAASADIAWDQDGLTQETGVIDISLDKLRSSELTLDRMTSEFKLKGLFPPLSDGPQRVQVGRLDIGVPLVSGALTIDIISPEHIELSLEEFGLFGGIISSRESSVDPTGEKFELNLDVTGINLASILAFAEFGELQASGELEGRLPLKYDRGELRIDGGLLQTAAGGGVIRYKPAQIDEALSAVDRSSELALKAISNFAYNKFSIGINENDSEEIRLDIFMSGNSVDLFEGVPFEFNIVIEGPLRQIIQDSVGTIDLPEGVQELIDNGREFQTEPEPAPEAGLQPPQ